MAQQLYHQKPKAVPSRNNPNQPIDDDGDDDVGQEEEEERHHHYPLHVKTSCNEDVHGDGEEAEEDGGDDGMVVLRRHHHCRRRRIGDGAVDDGVLENVSWVVVGYPQMNFRVES